MSLKIRRLHQVTPQVYKVRRPREVTLYRPIDIIMWAILDIKAMRKTTNPR